VKDCWYSAPLKKELEAQWSSFCVYVHLDLSSPALLVHDIIRASLARLMLASASSILRKSRYCSVKPFCKP